MGVRPSLDAFRPAQLGRPLWVLPHALHPQEASAELRGLVRAAETEEPLPGAQVLLPGFESRSQTNEEGRFWMRDLPAGAHILEVRYLGRSSGRIEVRLEPGRVTSLELALAVEPVEVPELRVEVERRWGGKMAGFYERMEGSGGGRFITREEIEATPGTELRHVFRGTPGLRVRPCRDVGVGSGSVGCYALVSGRAMPSLLGGAAGPCLPESFLDGVRVPLNEFPLGINEISPDDVEGIEVYAGSAAATSSARSPRPAEGGTAASQYV